MATRDGTAIATETRRGDIGSALPALTVLQADAYVASLSAIQPSGCSVGSAGRLGSAMSAWPTLTALYGLLLWLAVISLLPLPLSGRIGGCWSCAWVTTKPAATSTWKPASTGAV